MASLVVEPSFHNIACLCLSYVGFSPAFRNHGCSGVINCSLLADKRLRSGMTPVSCLLCAAAQFLKKAIPSHAVYDTKRLFSSYCSHALFYRAPANASFLLHSTAPFKMNPLHIVLTYLPLKDQMAISQTCTFVHDVAAYIYTQ